MMIYEGLILLEQDIKKTIESNLERTGLLYRLYSRIKSMESVTEKVTRKKYVENGKLVQDIIGIRIMTYFSEDIEILVDYFSSIFDVISIEQDQPEIIQFNPVRMNLVCRMQSEHLKEFNTWKNHYQESFKHIDSTFEIQVRTTLSEGWHEIEHNMRYKCKNEWQTLEDESRMLNGIHATLTTSDKTLIRLFEEISYQHYKNRNWTGMLRNKFRLHFTIEPLSASIIARFNADKELAKRFYKIERNSLISELMKKNLKMDISFNNIIYLSNFLFIKDERILQSTPPTLLDQLSNRCKKAVAALK